MEKRAITFVFTSTEEDFCEAHVAEALQRGGYITDRYDMDGTMVVHLSPAKQCPETDKPRPEKHAVECAICRDSGTIVRTAGRTCREVACPRCTVHVQTRPCAVCHGAGTILDNHAMPSAARCYACGGVGSVLA